MPPQHQSYDHRLRELITRTGDLKLADRYGVPRGTARSWIRRGERAVVTCPEFDKDSASIALGIVRLERRVEVLIALIRLLLVLVRVSGARLNGQRLPEGEDKVAVTRAVEKAASAIPLRLALRVIGLTAARYHAWQRAGSVCELRDESSCPKTHPTRLTAEEVGEMRDMVTSGNFRHMSIRALAPHAQRMGRVFASPGTWWHRARLHGWIRPRLRLHPPKPKVGVIDNFSRKLLAWEVATTLDPTTTCRVLVAAGQHLGGFVPTVVADSGGENFNAEVDDLIARGVLKRILAQVDVSYSNSVIEAWWTGSS